MAMWIPKDPNDTPERREALKQRRRDSNVRWRKTQAEMKRRRLERDYPNANTQQSSAPGRDDSLEGILGRAGRRGNENDDAGDDNTWRSGRLGDRPNFPPPNNRPGEFDIGGWIEKLMRQHGNQGNANNYYG